MAGLDALRCCWGAEASGSVATGIPVGYFTDIKPVLADARYLDYNPTVTADGWAPDN